MQRRHTPQRFACSEELRQLATFQIADAQRFAVVDHVVAIGVELANPPLRLTIFSVTPLSAGIHTPVSLS